MATRESQWDRPRTLRRWVVVLCAFGVLACLTGRLRAEQADAAALLRAYWGKIRTVRLHFEALDRTPKWGDHMSWGEYLWRTDGSAGRLDMRLVYPYSNGEWKDDMYSRSWLRGRSTSNGYGLNNDGIYGPMVRIRQGRLGWVLGAAPPHDFNCPRAPVVTWPEVAQNPGDFRLVVERAPAEGLVVLRGQVRQWEFRTWMDPGRGLLPVRHEATSPKGVQVVVEVVDAVEVDAGLWYPTAVRRTCVAPLDDEGPDSTVIGTWISEYSYTDLVVNGDLPDEWFEIHFPAGATVYDEINKRTYVVGAAEPGGTGEASSPRDARYAESLEKHLSEALAMALAKPCPGTGGTHEGGGSRAGVSGVSGWWTVLGAICGLGLLVPLMLTGRRIDSR